MEEHSDWPEIEEVAVLEQTKPTSKAIALFQAGYEIIIVLDEFSRFVGVIRTRNVIGKGINPAVLCKSYLDKNIPIILEEELNDFDPMTVGAKMIDGATRYIPIIDKHSKLKGVFKDSTVLAHSSLDKEKFQDLRIEEAVNWNLVYLTENDSIGSAIAKMREYGFSRIPVLTSSGEFRGVIIDRSLLRKHIEKRTTSGDIVGSREKDWHLLPVSDFLSSAEFLTVTTPLLEAIDKLAKLNFHTLFVKDNSGNYGIITALDLLQFLLNQSKTIIANIIVMEAPDEDIQNHAIRKGRNIMEREQKWLGRNSRMRIRFKKNLSQSKRGQFSITAMIRLDSEKGYKYNTESTDFGAEKTVNKALDNISRIISHDKRKFVDRRVRSFSKRKITDLEL